MWISTFASVLSTSGKAGGCRQDSRSINDSLQRVSRHTVSSDLSLWGKQSMDWCSAQSDTLSSRPLPTRHVRKPSMFVWGEGGVRCVYCLFPMNFNIRLFSLRHYLEETAFSLWHFKKKEKKCICGLLPIYFYLIPFNCSAFKVFGEAPHGRTLQVSICWGLTALNGSHILTSTQAVKYRPDSPLHH